MNADPPQAAAFATPPTDAELEALGASLRAALAGVLDALPESGRTAEALTKRFPIDGSVARRVIRTVNAPTDLQAVARSPGVKQLRKLAQSAAAQELVDAVARLDAAIKANGRSKAELTKRIRDDQHPEQTGP